MSVSADRGKRGEAARTVPVPVGQSRTAELARLRLAAAALTLATVPAALFAMPGVASASAIDDAGADLTGECPSACDDVAAEQVAGDAMAAAVATLGFDVATPTYADVVPGESGAAAAPDGPFADDAGHAPEGAAVAGDRGNAELGDVDSGETGQAKAEPGEAGSAEEQAAGGNPDVAESSPGGSAGADPSSAGAGPAEAQVDTDARSQVEPGEMGLALSVGSEAESGAIPKQTVSAITGERQDVSTANGGGRQSASPSSGDATPEVVLKAAAATSGADDGAALPARYDLRENGVLSPVKQQDPWGTCWAFAVSAASEASILSELGLTFADLPIEFSPRHLAWFAAVALPDEATMQALLSQLPYASQATEGTTVLPSQSNIYAHPLETGGFSFTAATQFAAGMGPVYLLDAPYRNEENMAVDVRDEPIGYIRYNQTLEQFLAENPGEQYFYFVVTNEAGDSSATLELPREVTERLVKQGVLSHYAIGPAFDAHGYPILPELGSKGVYTWGLPESMRFTRAYELEEYHALPNPTGGYAGQGYAYDESATNAIKRELMAGRAVTASIFDDSSGAMDGRGRFTNSSTWSQYTIDWNAPDKIYGAAHAITIVGWDDNWSPSNFNQHTVTGDNGVEVAMYPPAPGAWIVRNSYGREGADFPNAGKFGIVDPATGKHTGYFYVSYYDHSLANPASFDFDVSGHVSDFINQHDLMPSPVPHTEKFEERTLSANVFTAAADQVIRALSVETETPNTHVKLQLWRLREGATSPVDGQLLETVEATFEWGGFYRLELSRGYRMLAGQAFSVVAELITSGDGGPDTYHVPVHRDVNERSIQKFGKAIETYVKGVVNPGESFLFTGGAWQDWAELVGAWKQQGRLVWYYDYDNFSLKAYADAAEPDPDPNPDKPVSRPQQVGSLPVAVDAAGQVAPAGESPRTGDGLPLDFLAAMAALSAVTAAGAARAGRRQR